MTGNVYGPFRMGKMMTKTNLFRWLSLDDYVRDEMKGFMFSFELMSTTLIGFIAYTVASTVLLRFHMGASPQK